MKAQEWQTSSDILYVLCRRSLPRHQQRSRISFGGWRCFDAIVHSAPLQPALCMLTSPKGSYHITCVQNQEAVAQGYKPKVWKVRGSGNCCECRLADHLLMAQRMQQPDEQDSRQPSAPMDSSQEDDAAAQVPATGVAVGTEPQLDEQNGADQAPAAKQPDAAVRTLAKVFPHVNQPANAAKKANPKLGPLDRRKRGPQASHAEILAGS